MANKLIIDTISYGGTDYEFADQTARKNAAELSTRVTNLNDAQKAALNNEKERAMNAEKALEESKLSKVAGKGLSTNDFTDEYKDRIDNPPPFIGCTEETDGRTGNVPAPNYGDQEKYLRADGTWAVPHDTTYDEATQRKAGLMSASDKEKVDKMQAEPDEVQTSALVFNGNVISETLGNGKTKTITFNTDGSITEVISKSGVPNINLHTVFNSDGSITRTRS